MRRRCWQNSKAQAAQKTVSAKALAFFERVEDTSFDGSLERIRPHKLSQELKDRIHVTLPCDVEAKPSAERRAKLEGLAAVLEYHDRNGSVEFKVLCPIWLKLESPKSNSFVMSWFTKR